MEADKSNAGRRMPLTCVKTGAAGEGRMESSGFWKGAAMANLTRYNPFDELFNEFSKGFWVKPLASRPRPS
jgi:hypothetical protein